MKETKMDKITTEFAEHICDNLCRYPHLLNEEELEDKCLMCEMGKFICDILNEHNRILEQVQEYKKLGTLEELQELKERDVAKRQIKTTEETGIRYTDSYRCPNCGGGFTGTGIADFCYHCGQRIDWSEV